MWERVLKEMAQRKGDTTFHKISQHIRAVSCTLCSVCLGVAAAGKRSGA